MGLTFSPLGTNIPELREEGEEEKGMNICVRTEQKERARLTSVSIKMSTGDKVGSTKEQSFHYVLSAGPFLV